MIGFPKDQIKVGLINATIKDRPRAFDIVSSVEDSPNQLLSMSDLGFSDT